MTSCLKQNENFEREILFVKGVLFCSLYNNQGLDSDFTTGRVHRHASESLFRNRHTVDLT